MRRGLRAVSVRRIVVIGRFEILAEKRRAMDARSLCMIGATKVAGFVVADLDDELTEVRFDEIEAGGFEEMSEFDLLAGHRFAFNDARAARVFGDVGDDSPGGITVGGKMDFAAVALDSRLHLLDVIVEIVECMLLDVAGKGSQRIGIGQRRWRRKLPPLVLPHHVLAATAVFRRSSAAAVTLNRSKSKPSTAVGMGVIVVAAVF